MTTYIVQRSPIRKHLPIEGVPTVSSPFRFRALSSRRVKDNLKSLLVASSLVLLSACAGTKTTAAADPCAIPAPDKTWQVDRPSVHGFSEEMLCKQLHEIASGPDNVHSILIERHGKLVAELYRSGQDTPIGPSLLTGLFPTTTQFSETALHDVRSVSKSIIGLLIGISIDGGKLRLKAPFLDYYPELHDYRTNGREHIELQHLLTMSAGLEWSEMGHGFFTSSETPLLWQKEPLTYYLDRKLLTPPGQKFNYSGGTTMALADLLVRVHGRPLNEIVRDNLFDPLEITEWEWVPNIRGIPMAYAGLRMKPRDMLKIGRLIRNGGNWNGRQIVSHQWIEGTMQPHVQTNIYVMGIGNNDVNYGYQWWNGTVDWRGKKLQWSAAIGNGGQRILVVPALDVTLVTTGGDYGSPDIQKRIGGIVADIMNTVIAE